MNIFLSVIFILSLCRGLMNLQASDGLILCDFNKRHALFAKSFEKKCPNDVLNRINDV